MPNRYEREIEEILRNLEQPETKAGLGQRFSGRLRRKSGPRPTVRQRNYPTLNLSTPEWLLLIAVIAGLVAGGYAYIRYSSGLLPTADIFSFALVVISVICLILVALSQFRSGQRAVRSKRYGNVTITPLRRNPLSSIRTQWNLLMLKLRYRRKNEE